MGWAEPYNEQQTFNDWVARVPPEMLDALIKPRGVWSEGPPTPQEQQNYDLSERVRQLNELAQPGSKGWAEKGVEDTSDDLLNLTDPIQLKSIAKWGLKGFAEGALPAAAGMVRMGGKEFSNALLHRALSAEELPNIAELYQKGLTATRPTSAVTPSHLATFGSEPYGLLWHAKNPENVSWAAPKDVWSERDYQPVYNSTFDAIQKALSRTSAIAGSERGSLVVGLRDRLQELAQNPELFDQIQRMVQDTLHQNYTVYPNDLHEVANLLMSVGYPLERRGWEPMLGMDIGGKLNKIDKYDHATSAVRAKSKTLPQEEIIYPTLANPETLGPNQGLDYLFNRQREHLSANLDPNSPELFHNEIAYKIGDPRELAGVRLPLGGTPAWKQEAQVPFEWGKIPVKEIMANPAMLDERTYGNLERALMQFAEQKHVPIYRWPAEMTQGQQLKGLEAPFEGKWGYPPGRKDYITSSMLKKIFGITELP